MWELTEFDLNRKPQSLIVDPNMFISPRLLSKELMCPICLDVLTRTMTTKDCLHRFCTDCIAKALRSGNKECPTCRKKLVSLRCLRHDPNFDQMIKKIFPDSEEVEKDIEPTKHTKPTVLVENCEVILHDRDGGSKPRFVKCPFETTVGHLTKYLSLKPKSGASELVENGRQYRLTKLTFTDGSRKQYVCLDDESAKVKDISKEKPLELYYVLVDDDSDSS